MLVYRSAAHVAEARARLGELTDAFHALHRDSAPGHDALVELLIELGALEAALCDAAAPERDDDDAATRALAPAMLAIAAAVVSSWYGERHVVEPGTWTNAALEILRRTSRRAPRESVHIAVPEGYAYYALYPETYIAAAEQLAQRLRPRHDRAIVIGIRSIGTSLSAVVAAALAARGVDVCRYTVRPRGHPFDRTLALAPSLARALRDASRSRGCWFAVVDEGPGLSGSSFAAVADALSAAGVADDRIVLMPSWNPDAASLRSARGRARWAKHEKLIGDFDHLWMHSGRLLAPFGADVAADLSAGAWRGHVYDKESEFPAVQPQHEQRKLLCTTARGERILLKFVGLGRHGRARAEHARRLAAAGYTSEVVGLANGFMATRWTDGVPLPTPPDREHDGGYETPGLLAHAGRYLAHLRATERAPADVSPRDLLAMMRTNVREGLGDDWLSSVEGLASLAECVARAPTVRVDGRMMPHEWLRTRDGYLKTDAIAHHNDHFLPGPQDIAWDLAGTITELRLDSDAERALLHSYVAHSGDREVGTRLPFFRAAYLAFRLGYATLACESLAGSGDGIRMRSLRTRYADDLRTILAPGKAPSVVAMASID